MFLGQNDKILKFPYVSLYVATHEENLINCHFDQETVQQIFFYTGTYSTSTNALCNASNAKPALLKKSCQD